MRKIPKFGILLLLSFATFPSALFALEVPAAPEGRVSDYAGMIPTDARARLEEKLRRFEEETSNQVVVVTFPSLEGEALEDFSIRLAERWKIGQKGKDNGAILLIFKEDRAVRIEVGYGLEAVLPDATSKLIIENEIVPRFREGKFNQGIESAVQAIMAATRGEYGPAKRKFPEAMIEDWGAVFIIGVCLGAFLPLAVLRILFFLGIVSGVWFLVRELVINLVLSLFLGMMPVIFYYLLGRHRRESQIFTGRGARSSGSSWGGFGGGFGGGGFSGGGGSFGGGGASGRW